MILTRLTFLFLLQTASLSEPEVGPLVARWVGMWNSYDLDLVDDLFLTEDRVTYLSSEKEGLIRGIEAVREHRRGFGFVAGGKEADPNIWWTRAITLVSTREGSHWR